MLPFQPQALVFDLMGTCLDWYTSLLPALQTASSSAPTTSLQDPAALSQLALDWRQGFFEEIQARFDKGEEQEDIDCTHRRVLDRLLQEKGVGEECIVLANGTVRLQLDLIRSSGLPFHTLFSSQLLGLTKVSVLVMLVMLVILIRVQGNPDPQIYLKALNLVQIKPEDALMVAAHAYDLRAAAAVGMKTAYIQRWTEDPLEDMQKVARDSDVFVDGRGGSPEVGLAALARMLGA
ncbi:hypothetical protein JCM11641_001558 [Rhodosporidiobolus odoratus]